MHRTNQYEIDPNNTTSQDGPPANAFQRKTLLNTGIFMAYDMKMPVDKRLYMRP